MAEDQYCWWPHLCEERHGTYKCCHFCELRTKCKYPCSDDLKACKYRSDVPGDLAVKRASERDLAEFYAKQEKKKAKPEINNQGKLYKISEVAKAINQNYDFVYNKVKSGEIEGVQVGSRYFINEEQYKAITTKYKVK